MTDISWRVIVSKMSGGGKVFADWPQIAKQLEKSGIDYSEKITDHGGHAKELASEAVKEGFRNILVVGGDGALHEVLNGVCSQTEVPTSEVTLALVPVGSGNDWSRLHHIPRDYSAAVALLDGFEKRVRVQDVAKIDTIYHGTPHRCYMVNTGGLGLDAEVCHLFDLEKARGKAGDRQYFKCLLNGFASYHPQNFKVKVDGRVFFEGPAFSVALGIGKYCGGGMMQTPDALYDDGLIDVTVVKPLSKLRFITKVPVLFNGKILSLKAAEYTRGKVLEITATPDSFLEADGEAVGNTPVRVEVLPSAIRIVSNL